MQESDIKWLKSLSDQIWTRYPPSHNSYGHSSETRPLTEEEWARFCLIATSNNGCFTELGSGVFGFGFSVSLWLDPILPFPGVDIDSEHLISITGHHLPGEYDQDKSWDEFHNIANTENNVDKLKEFKRRPIQSKDYYDY